MAREIEVQEFFDEETNQIVLYCKELELSGYGPTKEQAIEMLEFQVRQEFLSRKIASQQFTFIFTNLSKPPVFPG